MSVAAPTAHRETALLLQWVERNGRSFAWTSINEADDVPGCPVALGPRGLTVELQLLPISGSDFDLPQAGVSSRNQAVTRFGGLGPWRADNHLHPHRGMNRAV